MLGIIGFFSLVISVISIIFLVKYSYFTEVDLVGKVFNSQQYCNEDNITAETKENCSIYMTVNWLIVSTISSIVLAFITLFPFFIMKKKKQN